MYKTWLTCSSYNDSRKAKSNVGHQVRSEWCACVCVHTVTSVNRYLISRCYPAFNTGYVNCNVTIFNQPEHLCCKIYYTNHANKSIKIRYCNKFKSKLNRYMFNRSPERNRNRAENINRHTSRPFCLRDCTVTFLASPLDGRIGTLNGESGICSSLNFIETTYSPAKYSS